MFNKPFALAHQFLMLKSNLAKLHACLFCVVCVYSFQHVSKGRMDLSSGRATIVSGRKNKGWYAESEFVISLTQQTLMFQTLIFPAAAPNQVKLKAAAGCFQKKFPLAARQVACARELEVPCCVFPTFCLLLVFLCEALDLLTYHNGGNFATANTSQSIDRMHCTSCSAPLPCITS